MHNQKDNESPKLIPAHGGYRDLRSYQMSEIVYDATVAFCDKFILKFSHTHDQMVQAARSGKQNIAEGCMASGTSKKTELKLIFSYLLNQQLRTLEKDFVNEGGFTERLYRTRTEARKWKKMK
ncbi:MAG: four helix bundle suffix domain-containing protein [Desulfobacteraceae bacterium]|jgi:four helix bundle suffix protein